MEKVWAFFVGGSRDATWLEIADRPSIEFPLAFDSGRPLEPNFVIERYVRRVWARCGKDGQRLRDSVLIMAHEKVARTKNELDRAANAAFIRAAAPYMLRLLCQMAHCDVSQNDAEYAVRLAAGELPATEMREGHLLTFKGVPIEKEPG